MGCSLCEPGKQPLQPETPARDPTCSLSSPGSHWSRPISKVIGFVRVNFPWKGALGSGLWARCVLAGEAR